MLERRLRLSAPIDLRLTLGPLRRGTHDPAHRFDAADTFWRTSRTAAGVATLAVRRGGDGDVHARAWGPGAAVVLDGLPALLGADDDWSALQLGAVPLLARVQRDRPGLRLTCTGLVLDALIPAILEQKVTGGEARRAWRSLLYRYGEPAPGPLAEMPPAMAVMPTPEALRQVPTWDWHRFGVDAKRMRTIRAVAAVASRLEEAATMPAADAARRLQLIPGVGVWTVAETVQRALGCPDTVSVGDFHIPNRVVHVLTGAARGTDEQMLAALAPWSGQRQRVVRLIEICGVTPPKFGPRYAPLDTRAM